MVEFDRNDSESRRLDDGLTVVQRRTDRLLALGYPLRAAAYGCPAETAARIAG